MKLPYQKLSPSINPFYASEGAAGFDLQATHRAVVKLGKVTPIQTGLAVAIPEGYVGQIWPRSGLSSKQGVHRTAGIIDSDFRGEIKVPLVGFSAYHVEIEPYQYIAQLLILPVEQVELEEWEEIPEDTKRGAAGFGANNPPVEEPSLLEGDWVRLRECLSEEEAGVVDTKFARSRFEGEVFRVEKIRGINVEVSTKHFDDFPFSTWWIRRSAIVELVQKGEEN